MDTETTPKPCPNSQNYYAAVTNGGLKPSNGPIKIESTEKLTDGTKHK